MRPACHVHAGFDFGMLLVPNQGFSQAVSEAAPVSMRSLFYNVIVRE